MSRHVRNAIHTISTVVGQSVVSGAVALGTASVYSLGFFWSGRSPAHQTRVEFLAATMAHLNFFFAVSIVLSYSVPLARHRSVEQRERPPSQLFWCVRLLQETWCHYIASVACVVGINIASAKLSERWKPYLVHFYAGALVFQYYVAVLDVTARTLYQTETVKGVATRPIRKRPPTWKRIAKAYVTNSGQITTAFAASAYIQFSSRLELDDQETFMVFSLASTAIRVAIMKMLLWAVSRKQTIHVRLLYLITAVPTVMISTQVRVALLRVKGSVSITSVVLLALAEPLMRVCKVWRVRRAVNRKLIPSIQAIRGISPSALRPVHPNVSRTSRPVMAQPVRTNVRQVQAVRTRIQSQLWTSRLDAALPSKLLLHFTAAEIHADMCSEYIAIVCSLAIFYCIEGHPRFAWPTHASTTSLRASRIKIALLQIAIELIIDTTCCLWELVNGIPLRTSRELNRFLLGLFTACAVINTGICCSIYVK